MCPSRHTRDAAMNYYYELRHDRAAGFRPDWPYWCMVNCSIADGGHMPHRLHEEFVNHSARVWLENVNGVYLIKPDWYGVRHRVDAREFTWVKLKSYRIEHD